MKFYENRLIHQSNPQEKSDSDSHLESEETITVPTAPEGIEAAKKKVTKPRADFREEMQEYITRRNGALDTESPAGKFGQVIEKYDFAKTRLDEIKEDTKLSEAFKEIKKIAASKDYNEDPILKDGVDYALTAIKAELLARVDNSLEKDFKAIEKKYKKQGFFVVEKNEDGGFMLTNTPKFDELVARLEARKATDKDAELYADVQVDLKKLQDKKQEFLDNVNEDICDDAEKKFYEGMRRLRDGKPQDAQDAKNALLEYQNDKGEKDEILAERTSDALKGIAFAEIEALSGKLDWLKSAANAGELKNVFPSTVIEWDSLNTKHVLAVVKAQEKVLFFAKALISSGKYTDLSSAITAISKCRDNSSFKALIGDSYTYLDNSDWGNEHEEGPAFWVSKFNTIRFDNKGKEVPNAMLKSQAPYSLSFDLLRSYNGEGQFTDEIGTTETNGVNWGKIKGMESHGQFPQVAALWKKHFVLNDFYKKYANNPEHPEYSFDGYKKSFDKDPEKMEDIDDEIKDYLHQLYVNHQMLATFGVNIADTDEWFKKDSTDPKHKKLYAFVVQLRESFIESSYEDYLHKEVIMQNDTVKRIYTYFRKKNGILEQGDPAKTYQQILTEGLPKDLFKVDYNKIDDLATFSSTPKDKLTRDQALALQFCIYDKGYQQKNDQWGILSGLRMTNAEWDEYKEGQIFVDIGMIMMSAGLSYTAGRTIAEIIGKKMLVDGLKEGTLATIAKHEGIKVALRTVLVKELVPRGLGFLVETLTFQISEMIFNQLRYGFNGRALTDWKANFKQFTMTLATLGTLRGAGMVAAKYLRGAAVTDGLLTRGAKATRNFAAATTMDTAVLTGVHVGMGALWGDKLEDGNLLKMARSNVIMSCGIRTAHYAVNYAKGFDNNSPQSRLKAQVEFNKNVVLKEAAGEKSLTDAERTFLAAKDLELAPGRELNVLSPLANGMTPNEARVMIDTLKNSPTSTALFGRLGLEAKRDLLSKIKALKAGEQKLNRDELMDGLKNRDESYAQRVKVLLTNSDTMPLTAEDIMKFQEADPAFLDDVLFMKIMGTSMETAKGLAKLFIDDFTSRPELKAILAPLGRATDLKSLQKIVTEVSQSLFDLCTSLRLDPKVLFLTIFLSPKIANAGYISDAFSWASSGVTDIAVGSVTGVALGLTKIIAGLVVPLAIASGGLIGAEKLGEWFDLDWFRKGDAPLLNEATNLGVRLTMIPRVSRPSFVDVPTKITDLLTPRTTELNSNDNLIRSIDNYSNVDLSQETRDSYLIDIGDQSNNVGMETLTGTALSNKIISLRRNAVERNAILKDEITQLNSINVADFEPLTLGTSIASITNALTAIVNIYNGFYPKSKVQKSSITSINEQATAIDRAIDSVKKINETITGLYNTLADPAVLLTKRNSATPPRTLTAVINDINGQIANIVATQLNPALVILYTTVNNNVLRDVSQNHIKRNFGSIGNWVIGVNFSITVAYIIAIAIANWGNSSNQPSAAQQAQQAAESAEATFDNIKNYHSGLGWHRTYETYDQFVIDASSLKYSYSKEFSELTVDKKQEIYDSLPL